MINKKIILYIFLLIAGFSTGYFLKPTLIKPATTNPTVDAVKENKIPECFADICPRYFSMDVDNDNSSSESVVVIPTRMTQGAGKIMVIKNGKVIFESSEMANIGVESVKGGDGFILTYSSPRDENGNRVDYSLRYRYRNGQFKAEDQGEKEKEKECVGNNGIWTKGPFGEGPFCNRTFSDGGKECRDSFDCLSAQCISFDTENDNKKATGKCSNVSTNYGCYGLIKKGQLTGARCVD